MFDLPEILVTYFVRLVTTENQYCSSAPTLFWWTSSCITSRKINEFQYNFIFKLSRHTPCLRIRCLSEVTAINLWQKIHMWTNTESYQCLELWLQLYAYVTYGVRLTNFRHLIFVAQCTSSLHPNVTISMYWNLYEAMSNKVILWGTAHFKDPEVEGQYSL